MAGRADSPLDGVQLLAQVALTSLRALVPALLVLLVTAGLAYAVLVAVLGPRRARAVLADRWAAAARWLQAEPTPAGPGHGPSSGLEQSWTPRPDDLLRIPSPRALVRSTRLGERVVGAAAAPGGPPAA